MWHMATTGNELKVQRVIAKVKAKDLAAQMGIGPWTISKLESAEYVDLETVARYMAALRTCGTVRKVA